MAGDAKGSPPLALLSGVRISSGIMARSSPTRWESLDTIPAVIRGSVPPVRLLSGSRAVVPVRRGDVDGDELGFPGLNCSAEANRKDLTGKPVELFWGNT